jgi:hypothetical protein
MTDKERLKKLLLSFNVEFKEENIKIILETKTKNVEGYSGFICEYVFTEDGEFIEIGIWE